MLDNPQTGVLLSTTREFTPMVVEEFCHILQKAVLFIRKLKI